jgi:hypothetical protein
MNKGKMALRLIVVAGLAAFFVADWIGDHRPVPPWFASGLGSAATVVAVSTALLWIVLEVLLHGVRHRGAWATAYAICMVAVVIPALYLITAATAELKHANDSTWHLLGMFAVGYQVTASVFIAAVAGAIALALWIARTAARRIEDKRAQAG